MIGWLQITSGRGPEECRWVVCRLAAYVMGEALRQGLRARMVEAAPGNLPGTLKSALISIEGNEDVSRFISSWSGTVQWIGNSMFRSSSKRKNWFVGVQALEAEDRHVWRDGDIRVESMRSSGPGGQHVNKTETAIRVTHIPTGSIAISRQERSQWLNKRLALTRLRELLRKKAHQSKREADQSRWRLHDSIERGRAAHVFKGMDFRRVS